MEMYETEREQVEAMKKWWQQNGKAVTTGLILGLASLLGWQQWQAYTQTSRETASAEYTLMIDELSSANYDAVRDRGNRIISNYSSTPYAAMAALAVAKADVEKGELTAAHTHLQMAIDMAKQDELKYVARARLARVMIDEDQASAAVSLLKTASAPEFDAVYQEIMGDAYVAMGNVEQARAAYESAKEAAKDTQDTSVLQMKLDELGAVEAQH